MDSFHCLPPPLTNPLPPSSSCSSYRYVIHSLFALPAINKYNIAIFSTHSTDETTGIAKLLKEINYAIKQAALERKVNGVCE